MTTDDRHEELYRRVTSSSMSRRHLLRVSTGLVGAGMLSTLLAACGEDDGGDEPGAQTDTDTDTNSPTEPAADDTSETPAGTDSASEPPGDGVMGGLLRVAIIGEPPAFDPTFTTATVTQNTTWHVFESLFYPDANFAPQPMLLESFEVEENGAVFVFHIRENVPFHNGEMVAADDVIASLQRYAELSGRGRTLFERVESLEADDELTVRMTFSAPTGIAPIYLSQTDAIIIPKEIAEASMAGEMTEFIGTGPFMLNERLPDRYISLLRFEDYAKLDVGPDGYGGGKTAYFDEIRFVPVPEAAVRSDGLITDEYDFAETLSTDQFESLSSQPELEMQVALPYYFYGAHFNKSEESMMSNRDLRMALLTAVDMEPIARAGFGPEQFWRLGPEIAAPETAWYSEAGSEIYNQADPDKAKQMLQDAGYDGTPIRWISTKEYSYNYNMALVLKEQLEAIGAVIDLQVMDWATLVATRSQKPSWDVFITGHDSYRHPVLQVFLNETWPGFWANEEKDEIITKIIEEPDPAVQMEHITALQQVWWEDAAMIKVNEGATLRGYRTRLEGYASLPDWFFWNAWFAEE